MDPVGTISSLVTSQPAIPAPSAQPQQAGATTLPDGTQRAAQPDISSNQAAPQAQAIDQKRYEAVQHAAQQIANVYVLGDQSFTIFKDATGQYITRYTSLRDGKVTYIPEPTLLEMHSGSSNTSSGLVDINA